MTDQPQEFDPFDNDGRDFAEPDAPTGDEPEQGSVPPEGEEPDATGEPGVRGPI